MSLNKYHREPGENTPFISLDPVSGIFEIRGISTPDNTLAFYKPFFLWLDDYVKSPAEITTLNIQLDYFNTSTSKTIFDAFRILENLHYRGKGSVVIIWLFNINDDDMQEAGEEYKSMLKVPFELKSFTS